MKWSAKISILILIIVIYVGEMSKSPDDEYPKMEPSPAETPLPPLEPLPDSGPEGSGEIGPSSPSDGIIEIEEEEKDDKSLYTGTAFSIDGRGLWVTARHVTDGCDQLVLRRPHRRALNVDNISEHNRADVSILQTRSGYSALAVDFTAQQYNQEGFHYGFPRGEAGAIYSKLIGRRTIKSTGARYAKESVLVWAEKIRIPKSNESLGGISGGPILNKEGSVVGVHIAGSIRRGRSFSSLPVAINDILEQNQLELNSIINSIDIGDLNSADFANVGEDLRSRITVVKVVCRTD